MSHLANLRLIFWKIFENYAKEGYVFYHSAADYREGKRQTFLLMSHLTLFWAGYFTLAGIDYLGRSGIRRLFNLI